MPKTPKIEIEQDQIFSREDEAMAFLKQIFGLDNAMITDITELSDFSYSGLNQEQSEKFKDMIKTCETKELNKYWDNIILARIKEYYDIELDSVCVTLLEVLDKIQARKNPTLH